MKWFYPCIPKLKVTKPNIPRDKNVGKRPFKNLDGHEQQIRKIDKLHHLQNWNFCHVMKYPMKLKYKHKHNQFQFLRYIGFADFLDTPLHELKTFFEYMITAL